ncbi:MAG: hypothetical protein U0744_19065 [Gemmataceae bacterium]
MDDGFVRGVVTDFGSGNVSGGIGNVSGSEFSSIPLNPACGWEGGRGSGVKKGRQAEMRVPELAAAASVVRRGRARPERGGVDPTPQQGEPNSAIWLHVAAYPGAKTSLRPHLDRLEGWRKLTGNAANATFAETIPLSPRVRSLRTITAPPEHDF